MLVTTWVCGVGVALTGSDVPPLSLAARSRAYVSRRSVLVSPTALSQATSKQQHAARPYPQNDNIHKQAAVLAAVRTRGVSLGAHWARTPAVGCGIGVGGVGEARLQAVGDDADHGGRRGVDGRSIYYVLPASQPVSQFFDERRGMGGTAG